MKSNIAQFILLLFTFLTSVLWTTSSKAQGERPLTADAKISSAEIESEQIVQLEVELHLPNGYKAYQDKFKIQIPEGNLDFKISSFHISPTKEIMDKFTKQKKQVVINSAKLIAPVEAPKFTDDGPKTLKILLGYQACTETYCLFPETLTLEIPYTSKSGLAEKQEMGFFNLSFQQVYQRGLVWTFLFVFVFGLLTSLTPCVYPMIPITFAILGREAHARTKFQNFLVGLTYVSGIGITFSSLGVFAASTGILFGSFMSSPWVLGFICLVFFTMSLSMFGLFEIQAPQFLRDGMLSHLHLHGYLGALISGMLAGVVASPCVGPVLVGVLTFVAQTKNVWLGFWLLFTYAFGMGVLFLAIGASTSLTKLLPKSGHWMNSVKLIFATLLLGASLYYLDILLVSAKVLKQSVISSTVASIKSMALENTDKKFASPQANSSLSKIHWLDFSEQNLLKAKAEHKPVVIDFRADWCAACLELEHQTFSDPAVQLISDKFMMLRFDATQESPELEILKKKYGIVGLPTLIFIDRNGVWNKELTLTEFEPPQAFIKRLSNFLK